MDSRSPRSRRIGPSGTLTAAALALPLLAACTPAVLDPGSSGGKWAVVSSGAGAEAASAASRLGTERCAALLAILHASGPSETVGAVADRCVAPGPVRVVAHVQREAGPGERFLAAGGECGDERFREIHRESARPGEEGLLLFLTGDDRADAWDFELRPGPLAPTPGRLVTVRCDPVRGRAVRGPQDWEATLQP